MINEMDFFIRLKLNTKCRPCHFLKKSCFTINSGFLSFIYIFLLFVFPSELIKVAKPWTDISSFRVNYPGNFLSKCHVRPARQGWECGGVFILVR